MTSITLTAVNAFADGVPIKLPIKITFRTSRNRPMVAMARGDGFAAVSGLAALQPLQTGPQR